MKKQKANTPAFMQAMDQLNTTQCSHNHFTNITRHMIHAKVYRDYLKKLYLPEIANDIYEHSF